MTKSQEHYTATIDHSRKPVTEAEMEMWKAISPESRALFGGILSNTFRRLLAREGENFPAWIALAVSLNADLR